MFHGQDFVFHGKVLLQQFSLRCEVLFRGCRLIRFMNLGSCCEARVYDDDEDEMELQAVEAEQAELAAVSQAPAPAGQNAALWLERSRTQRLPMNPVPEVWAAPLMV